MNLLLNINGQAITINTSEPEVQKVIGNETFYKVRYVRSERWMTKLAIDKMVSDAHEFETVEEQPVPAGTF
jgi:hypothetical protein